MFERSVLISGDTSRADKNINAFVSGRGNKRFPVFGNSLIRSLSLMIMKMYLLIINKERKRASESSRRGVPFQGRTAARRTCEFRFKPLKSVCVCVVGSFHVVPPDSCPPPGWSVKWLPRSRIFLRMRDGSRRGRGGKCFTSLD